jgi:undecaprenyl diphosphate synthase
VSLKKDYIWTALMLDDYWPDFKPDHFFQALNWYQEQDVTLGG